MIKNAVREVIGNDMGAKVIIYVPNGHTLGEKTFNPKLGIIGGISIIGTTGIVRPMSEDAFKASLLCGLDIARGIGYDTVVLVPGSLSERSILNLLQIPRDQVIQVSNFIGFMLDAAQKRLFKRIILAGHPGKLAKLLRGDFYTHSSASKPANDIIIQIIKQITLSDMIQYRLQETPTVEGIVELLREHKSLSVMNEIADRIEIKIREFVNRSGHLFIPEELGIILFDMRGSVIGFSNKAQLWLNTIETRLSS